MQIQKKENRFYCSDSFRVASITYSEFREIAGLQIASGKESILFEWKMQDRKSGKKESSGEESVKKEPSQKNVSRNKSLSKTQIKGLETELQRTGVAMEAVQQRYHVDDPMQMSEETYNRVMNALSRTKSADVA